MIIIKDYNKFIENLTDMAIVVEDSSLNDEDRNIIIRAEDDTLYLMGSNITITHRIKLSSATTDNKNDVVCVRYKELMTFLLTYKSLSFTKVEQVAFEIKGNRLNVEVTEVEKETNTPHKSGYTLENKIVKHTLDVLLSTSIKTDKPNEKIKTEDFKYIINNMIQGMSTTNDSFGAIIFTETEDKCVVLNPAYTLVTDNPLPYKGIKLTKKCLNFINKSKYILKDEFVETNKDDKHIALITDTTETFLQYSMKLSPYKMYLEIIGMIKTTPHFIQISSDYFKDILKRLLISKDEVFIDIDCNDKQITISNRKYKQTIPLVNFESIDGYDNFRFHIAPEILSKVVLETDKLLTFNYTNTQGNDIFALSNESCKWYSILRVKLL